MTSDQLLQCRVQLPYHSVWRKKVFWTWLEEMFISSDMRGDILLLNIYCGAAMIEVCLWSKKSTIQWVFWATNCLQIDKVRTATCFSVLPLLCIMKRVKTAKKPTKSMISHQKTQQYIKGKSPLFIL